ncbi:CCR4-NOT transcription complex subunit 1 [Nematocida sp. LUAm1]|nr:CCR4-NOT transcription complex subunit 1 [Nematocida sp. LUAm1]
MWRGEQTKGSNQKEKTPQERRTHKDKETHLLLEGLLSKQEEKDLISAYEDTKEKHKDIKWKELLLSIDRPDLLIKGKQEATNYLALWSISTENEPFPYKVLFKKWIHQKTQAQSLQWILSLPPGTAKIHRSDTTSLIDRYKEQYEYHRDLKAMAESNYNCQELFQLAEEIEEKEGALLLSHGVSVFPELVAIGLSSAYPKYEKMFSEAFTYCMHPHRKSRVALKQIFEKKPKTTMYMISRVYSSSFTLEECLNAVIESKMLPYVLRELDPLEFSLDLIILAISKEIIDLTVILCSHSNEEFINQFIIHIILRYGKGVSKGVNIYPLTVDIIISTCLSLEGISKMLSKTTLSHINKLKSLLIPDIRGCVLRKTTLKQMAVEFLHNVITGKTSNSDAIIYMTQISSNKNSYDMEMLDSILKEMETKYAVIDRLSYYEIVYMAMFYGRVIKYEIAPIPSIKRIISQTLIFLKEDPSTNRFKFGMKMLETFCDILEKYPFYCQEFSRIPQVYATNKSLYTYIRGHLAIQNILSKEEKEEGTLFFNEYIQELFGKVEGHPGWAKQFNMLAPSNVHVVADAIRKESSDRIEPDLAKYLLVKRLLKETNYVRLYVDFIFTYSETLYLVVRELFFQILRSIQIRHKELERTDKISSMRIIGTYLGMLTLSDRVPIPRSQFNVKEFLIESMSKECIYSALVFVCKFVEECTSSKVFGRNSPYIKSILKILSEIHFLTEGSDLISLEIEICFSKISVRIEDTLPDVSIQERRLGVKKKAGGLARYIELDGVRSIIAHIAIMAINFAIRDITYSIVDKVFNISTRAAIEIVCRDFHKSKDSAILAFKNMSTQLAVNLACASATGPIFSGVTNNISHFLKLAGMEESVSQEKLQNLVKKNLSICLDIVEYITRMKLSQSLPLMIDELLEEFSQARKETKKLQSDYVISIYEKNEYKKPEHILVDEMHPVTIGEYHEICAYLCSINYKGRENGETLGPFSGSSAQKKWEEMQRVLQELERSRDEEIKPKPAIELLEAIHVILGFIHSGAHDMVCLFFCQNIIGSIFMLSNPWSRAECIKAVYKICKSSYSSQQEVSSWLIYAEDERKFNPEVIAQMLDIGIMNRIEYDIHLGATLLKNPHRIKFAADLLNRCLFSDVPIGTPFDFVCTIEAISKSSKGTTDERIKALLKEISKRIFLTRKETEEKNIFDNWVDALFYKVEGEERKKEMKQIIKIIEEKTKEKNDLKRLLKASFLSGVEYYLKLRKECSSIKYLKIEALASLVHMLSINDHTVLVKSLEILTEIFLDGIQIYYYQIQVVFTRFLQVIIDGLTSVHENILFSYLKVIRPSKLPVFYGGFLELLFCDYVLRNMFIRNPSKGLLLLEWVYRALDEIEPSRELDCAVYSCSAFALHLRKHAPSFYLTYSSLLLSIIPLNLSTVLLRSIWALERVPIMELWEDKKKEKKEFKERAAHKEYFDGVVQVEECFFSTGKPLDVGVLGISDTMLSHVLIDGLSNQREYAQKYQDAVVGLFSSGTSFLLKENLLARLLEKCSVMPPRSVFVKCTLDMLLNSAECVESLGTVLRKDKTVLGKMIIHISNAFVSDDSK